jgi:ATP-dependent RNA helicase DeaD
MGFVDDIEWILEQTPPERQIALFSATMPPAIRRIAQKHMRDPQQITIQNKASTTPKIRQRCWFVSGLHKLDALTRMLEVERFDAMLVFVRTKLETVDLADRLEARGFSAAALNGDIPQQQREKTVARLKNGQLDIVIATDVAARGLDVERISHVVNYDIPYDSETYVHRIGRTGRAGRSGEAILFVAPRERNMLRIIERVTKQRIEPMTLPSVADVNEQRVLKFKERVTAAVQNGEGKAFQELLAQIESDQNIPAIEIAAALAGLLQGTTPFLLEQKPGARENAMPGTWVTDSANDLNGPREYEVPGDGKPTSKPRAHREPRTHRESRSHAEPRAHGAPPEAHAEPLSPAEPIADAAETRDHDSERPPRPRREKRAEGDGPPMETFRIEVGHTHGVLPGNIVGAIANEAGLDGKHIGHIDIREDHSFVDLPEGMPKEIFRELKKVKVRGNELRISRVDSKPPRPERAGHRAGPRGPRTGFSPRGDSPDHRAGPPRTEQGDAPRSDRAAAPGTERRFGPRSGSPSARPHHERAARPPGGKPKGHRKSRPSREH